MIFHDNSNAKWQRHQPHAHNINVPSFTFASFIGSEKIKQGKIIHQTNQGYMPDTQKNSVKALTNNYNIMMPKTDTSLYNTDA